MDAYVYYIMYACTYVCTSILHIQLLRSPFRRGIYLGYLSTRLLPALLRRLHSYPVTVHIQITVIQVRSGGHKKFEVRERTLQTFNDDCFKLL